MRREKNYALDDENQNERHFAFFISAPALFLMGSYERHSPKLCLLCLIPILLIFLDKLLIKSDFSYISKPFSNFSERMILNNGELDLTGFDLGGHREVRRVWRDYYEAVDVLVFMVDAADTKRLHGESNF